VAALDKAAVAKKLDLPWLQGAAEEDADQGGASAAPTLNGDGEIIAPSPVPGKPADLQVVATVELPKSEAGYQEVIIFNTATGETTPVAKEKPLPWLSLENRGSLGAWYGFDGKLDRVFQAEGIWRFLQIKRVHLGIKGDLTTDGTGHLLGGVMYEW
jgi:hypothetical protein